MKFRLSDNPSSLGFTLIELMIVVTIIGILAAVAVPNFLKYQLKSRSSESANVGSIQTINLTFVSRWGALAQTNGAFPAGCGVLSKQPWVGSLAGAGGFYTLGWKATGSVYFCYCISSGAPVASAAPGAPMANSCNGTANTIIGSAAGRAVIVDGVVPQEGIVDVFHFSYADLDNDGASQGYLNTDESKELFPAPLNAGDEVF